MIYNLRPIVLAPLIFVAAAILHLRRGSLKSGPLDTSHSLSGLLALSGMVLVGLVPFLRLVLVLALPAIVGLLARLFGIWRALPTPLAIYTRVCIAASPVVVTGVFLYILIFDP